MDNYNSLNQQAFDEIAKKYGGYRRKTPEIILDFINESKTKILDLGCGNLSYALKYPNTIYGVDFSFNSLKKADRENIFLLNADISALPIKDKSFKRAMCVYTLHNLPPILQKEAMHELHRVLEKDGTALITVWSKFQKRFLNRENMIKFVKKKPIEVMWGKIKRYYFLFSKKQLIKICTDSGFKIEKIGEYESNSNKNYYVIIKKQETTNIQVQETSKQMKSNEFKFNAFEKAKNLLNRYPGASPK